MAKQQKNVRVRFSPSPTGFLHIGGLRTALFNYLFAKKNGGKMILRIEDTDRKRYVDGATEAMMRALEWAGIQWDEGPALRARVKGQGSRVKSDYDDVIEETGSYGPYVQSERRDIYDRHAKELVEKDAAYYCFCSAQRLEKLREQQAKDKKPPCYDGKCRTLEPEKVRELLDRDASYVIRLKVPKLGKTCFVDLVRDRVEFQNSTIDDQVLVKSDGFPTYHLAVVVDDHLMGITHVIRGEEWLPSTPKHVLLYQAFGWDLPDYAHLPLLVNAKKQKLSKRHGDVAVEDYVEQGYLPQALVNYVALLGWSPGGDQEIFSMKELIKSFDLPEVNKSAAVFDREKLDWVNGEYIRATDIGDLVELSRPYIAEHANMDAFDDDKLAQIVTLAQDRMRKLSDAWELTHYLFEAPEYDKELLRWKKMGDQALADSLRFAITTIQGLEKFDRESLEKSLISEIEKHGRSNGDVLWPLRAAMSGEKKSPSPFEILEVVGKDEAVSRLEYALELAA